MEIFYGYRDNKIVLSLSEEPDLLPLTIRLDYTTNLEFRCSIVCPDKDKPRLYAWKSGYPELNWHIGPFHEYGGQYNYPTPDPLGVIRTKWDYANSRVIVEVIRQDVSDHSYDRSWSSRGDEWVNHGTISDIRVKEVPLVTLYVPLHKEDVPVLFNAEDLELRGGSAHPLPKFSCRAYSYQKKRTIAAFDKKLARWVPVDQNRWPSSSPVTKIGHAERIMAEQQGLLWQFELENE